MIRRLIRRVIHEEDGIALVLALAAMTILAITTTGVIVAGTANESTAWTSTKERAAFALAQEGLAYAAGMLYGSASAGQLPPNGTQDLPPQPDGGSGTYYASTADGTTWHLVGTGTFDGVSRTVSATATPPSSTTVTDYSVWNYIYSNTTATPNCTTDTWDTLTGNTTVSVPIMTRGGFCINGGAKFINPPNGLLNNLNVGGTLTLLGGGQIGVNNNGVGDVEVAGSPSSSACENQQLPYITPGTGVCDGTHQDLWSQKVGTKLTVPPGWPTVDFAGAYAAQAVLPQSGCPANLFDNDTTMNNSDTLIASVLEGKTSYDCKLGSSSSPCLSTQDVCELNWDATTKTLAMTGRFYFDGSINSTAKVQYTGQATLYFTGQVEFSGGGTFCGYQVCTSNAWDPDVNGAIFVSDCWANSSGSTVVDPQCVYVTGQSHVQVGVFCETNYTIEGGSTNMGPVLANTFTLSGSASGLNPFHTYPPGTPLGTETISIPGTPPINWSG